MALKENKEGSLTAKGATEEGQEKAGQLTKAEIERLTDETVELLLKAGGGEAKAWIEKGRIIDGFVERLQPNGKFTKPNPYTRLVKREDIPWQASQLRAYRNAYLLWRKTGGADDVPKVDVTTVGLVMSLDDDEAQKILKRAAKDNLSTRQVAALVKKAKGAEAVDKVERVAGDWKALGKAAEAIISELSLMIDCPPPGPTDGNVVEKLEVVLKAIEDLIAKANTPEWGAR